MKSLEISLKSLPYYVPMLCDEGDNLLPRRKHLRRPETGFAFIAPMRQSVMKDARLMPGTRCMIALLAGWSGDGKPIDTTLGAVGKHLGRSGRQVQRYLRDAAEEGYLFFRQITDRLGYVIGLRISLCRSSIYAPKKHKRKTDRGRLQTPHFRAATQEANIKPIIYIKPETSDPFEKKLKAICKRNHIPVRSG